MALWQLWKKEIKNLIMEIKVSWENQDIFLIAKKGGKKLMTIGNENRNL